MITYKPATIDLLDRVALDVDEADYRELQSVTGLDGKSECVHLCCLNSTRTRIGIVGDEVIGMFGIVDADELACPWMIKTKHFSGNSLSAMRDAKGQIETWRKKYSLLFNWVHGENESAQNWLDTLGFKLAEPAPHGARGDDFVYFDMEGI